MAPSSDLGDGLKSPLLSELTVFSRFGSFPPRVCQSVTEAPRTGLPISETLPFSSDSLAANPERCVPMINSALSNVACRRDARRFTDGNRI